MARVVGNIPNFINGVSQQPAVLRLESQGEAQTNCYSTVARGLVPRPSTTHIAKLASSASATTWTHLINRDPTERYMCVYDPTASTTSPQKLTAAETNITTAWTSTGTMTSTAHSSTATDQDSPDGVSNFHRWVIGAGDYARLYPSFAHAASTTYTFSVWVRRVSGTAVDFDIILQGADITSTPVETDITATLNADTDWHKVEVSATTIGSPAGSGGSSHFEMLIDEASGTLTVDLFAPQLEAAAASTLSIQPGGSVRPRMRVFDLAGNEEQVWIPDGEAYLQTAVTPQTDLKATTVADYTFIASNQKTVAAGSTTSAADVYEAYVVFDTIQPGTDITVKINSDTHTVTVSDTDPTELGTALQAAAIYTLMTDGAGTNFNSGVWSSEILGGGSGVGSVIYITNSSADFTIQARDDQDGEGVRVIKDQVQTFGELPRVGKNGSKIEVKGNPDNDWSSYWVKFEGDDGDDGIATWSETVGPGETVDFDDTSMPHILVREASATFSFREAPWIDKAAGDSTTNPNPSFIGETINEVLFAEGRLGFLAGENIILSQADAAGEKIFNFWRTSVTTVLDDNPIDVAATHTKVSILKHAVAYQEQLLLFSEQTQFRLTKGTILSPRTVGIEVMTEFESSPTARPAAVGNFVFFVVEKSDYASVREYFVQTTDNQNDAREITAHIPQYIPSGINFITGTTNEDLILIGNSSERDTLYVYKFFWSGERKVQSSWSKFTFDDVTALLGSPGFIGSTLYAVVSRADGVFLESMEFDVGAQDDSNTGYSYTMDRKISSDHASVSAAYNSTTEQTTYTFSDITWKSVPYVAGISGNSVTYPVGNNVPIVGNPTSYDANTIIVDGDSTADTFLFGIPVACSYTVSEINVKASSGQGQSKVPVTEGRLQLQRIRFLMADTGYMKFTVTQDGRSTKEYEFTGLSLGDAGSPVNTLPVDDADYSVALYSNNKRVSVTCSSSSFLPFRLLSADWMGNWHARGRRI